MALPEKPVPWWELHGMALTGICNVCRQVHSLYTRQRAAYADLLSSSKQTANLTPRTIEGSPLSNSNIAAPPLAASPSNNREATSQPTAAQQA